ncbi:hypothetical protein CRYUN_Cryun23aG0006400 [Craigia yunnanensis]
METIGSIGSKAAEYTFNLIKRQNGYVFNHDSNVFNLKNQVEQLREAKTRVQNDVKAAERNREEIEDDVKKWLEDVDKINEDVDDVAEIEDEVQKRFFFGLCPDIKSVYQLSKRVENVAKTVAQLLEKKGQFGRISNCPSQHELGNKPVKDYESFESRNGALNGIVEALKDANLSIIGLYGIGGVGKTTLVKQVARQAGEEKLFNQVVMTTVAQSFDIKKIQDQIANAFGLRFDEQSDFGRACRLRDRLKKEKNILVILDDVWERLDLEAVGIPSRGDHQGCKILMTSREVNVLSLMDSQKAFAVDTLKEEEAWHLFKKMAGDVVESPTIRPIATQVAERCAGLPITIATIARALKNKNLVEWRNAVQELKRASERSFKGIPREVYSNIELSYKFLEVEKLQQIFLLCSIMGHNAAIEDLLKYGFSLDLFHAVDTIEEARNKVLAMIGNLKSSCLLLDSYTPSCFDMHDVVRDVAMSIAFRDHNWLVLGREDVFNEWSDEETIKKLNLISLQYSKVSKLPDGFDCPNLTFFFMGSEDGDFSFKTPNNFFNGMQNLKVLNFCRMKFSSLPSSFCLLANLCTLHLSNCVLEDIAIIGELKNLEILSLCRSKIIELPWEIGQLTMLRLLDLSDCDKLRVIPPNVLSSLFRLEELYLRGSFDEWEVEELDMPRSNASLVELKHLSQLAILELHIPHEQVMPKDLFFGELERYVISIGEKWNRCNDKLEETSRMLKLNLKNQSINEYYGVKILLKKVENLFLDEVKDVQNILYDLNTEGFQHLKHLCVSNVLEMKNIIDSKKLVSCTSFPLLETLSLQNLINLETICYGQLKAKSFSQLRTIKVKGCGVLKNLFSLSMARELSQLEEIEVSWCKNITEIIVKENEEDVADIEVNNLLEFRQLRSLTLNTLPKLKTFYSEGKRVSSSSGEGGIQTTMDGRTDATPLFNQKVVLPMLEELKIYNMENLERIWPDQQVAQDSFHNLISFRLDDCPKLLSIFPLNMLRRLERLEELIVSDCQLLEQIIELSQLLIQPTVVQETITFDFPQVKSLSLCKLPNLKCFYHKKNTTNWPSLKEIKVVGCDKLEIFASEYLSSQETERKSQLENPIQDPLFWVNKFTFPNLEEFTLGWNGGMKEVWHGQLAFHHFCKLKAVKVEEFPKQLARFPSYLLQLLSSPNLENFEICDCSFKEIFHCEGGVGDEKNHAMVPSKLSELTLFRLPKLMHLWKEKKGFQNLRSLEVEDCCKLKNLVPSSVSLQNLMTLDVTRCDGIIKLVTYSTAKSLVQLRYMRISQCYGIEEIIACGEDEVKDEISFPQLKHLELQFLPNLESFCSSRNCRFGFPSLEILCVEYCPYMKIFAQGGLNTPILQKVQLQAWGDKERWEGSLNNTIEKMFGEEEEYRKSLEDYWRMSEDEEDYDVENEKSYTKD